MVQKIAIALAVVALIAVVVWVATVVRRIDYAWKYEALVRETVRAEVRPECLRP